MYTIAASKEAVMIKCTLDEDECIDLLTVLRVINQINQEQAWAICYQMGVLMQRFSPTNCAPIEGLGQIQLHKDGYVHEKSCTVLHQHAQRSMQQQPSETKATATTIARELAPNLTTTTTSFNTTTITDSSTNTTQNYPHHHHRQEQRQYPTNKPQQHQQNHQLRPNSQLTNERLTRNLPTPPITPELNELLRRRPALNESELVASLGIALFLALDYGIPDDEERKLSIAMEYLIFQSQSELSLKEVLEICINRLPIATKSHADSHYKEVCRTLINDTIELSIFLEKIYTASMVLSDITLDDCLEANHKCDISDKHLSELGEPLASLRALRINDWARLWMQVIRELRQRGKFKAQATQLSVS